MIEEVKVYQISDFEQRELIPNSEVCFLHSENMTMAEWHFKPNTSLPEHSHPHEQVTKIISGEFELNVGGKTFRLKTGSAAVIPPNLIHSGKAITECHVIDVFHPVRDEYR